MSTPDKSPRASVLRLVAVVDDTLTEDLHQTSAAGVSVGTGYEADVLVFGADAPAHHLLFDYRGGTYVLDVPHGAKGMLRLRGRSVSVSRLRKKMGAKADESFRIKLDRKSKGKLQLGQSVLMFQFGPPKPVPAKLPFPAIFKASAVGMIGALALFSHFASFSILGPFFAWAHFLDVPDTEPEIDERFAIVMGLSNDEPPTPEEEEEVPDEEDPLAEEPEVKPMPKPQPAKPEKKLTEKPSTFSKEAIAEARSVGVARALGTYGGDGPGSLFDNIQSTENRLDELAGGGMTHTVEANGPGGDLAQLGGEGIELQGEVKGTKGFDLGEGPEVVAKAEKRERKVKGRTKATSTRADGGGDPNAIKATIKHRTSALQHCYNKALRTQPDLSGKMSFTIVVNVMGSVTKVIIDQDGLGSSAVAACTKAKIKGWRFPMNGADEGAEVSFSVVFSGS